jgi:hypothetical protein
MISKSTTYIHLAQIMRWKLWHYKQASHSLAECDKMNRVQRATELLELLQLIRHQRSHCIVTLEESWSDWEKQWLPDDDEPETRRRRGFDHSQTLLIIIWNPNDFSLIDAMHKGQKYSARYYLDNILTPICQRLIPTVKHQLVIHADTSGAPVPKSSSTLCRKEKSDLPRIPIFPRHRTI